MTDEIILRNAGGEISIRTPEFGYSANINLAMTRSNMLGGGRVNWFDHGSGSTIYDNRTSNLSFVLDAIKQKELQDFIKNGDQGRGNEIQIVCPDGISPFAPDVGYQRVGYQSRILSQAFSGVNRRPWIGFSSDITFLLTGSNRTQKPSGINPRGNFLEIGNVDGLRYPKDFPTPSVSYNVGTIATYGRNGHSIDSISGDSYQSTLRITEDTKKTAQLINYLVTRARGFEFFITAGKNGFVFGRDNSRSDDDSGGGKYKVVLFDNNIGCTHVSVDSFLTEFSVSMREYSIK